MKNNEQDKVYLLSLSEVEALPPSFAPAHFPRRSEKANRFRFRADYLRCIGAGALLYGVLNVREEDLSYGENGKPALPGPIHFNLSHSGDFTVLCVSNRPCGVDAEEIKPIKEHVAQRVYQSDETDYLSRGAIGDTERFYTLWSLKESVLKAYGSGFSVPANSFSVLPLLRGEPLCAFGKIYVGCTLPLPGYGLAFAKEYVHDESFLPPSVQYLTADDIMKQCPFKTENPDKLLSFF